MTFPGEKDVDSFSNNGTIGHSQTWYWANWGADHSQLRVTLRDALPGLPLPAANHADLEGYLRATLRQSDPEDHVMPDTAARHLTMSGEPAVLLHATTSRQFSNFPTKNGHCTWIALRHRDRLLLIMIGSKSATSSRDVATITESFKILN